MKKKVVFLQENMLDENEREVFQSGIPYEVEYNWIENDDGLRISLHDIWVDFHLVHQTVK